MFEFNLTLLANGAPSGKTYIKMIPGGGLSYETFPPSSNRPFQNSAWQYKVCTSEVSYVNDFVYGYMSVYDAIGRPVMNRVPFCAYAGDQWIQAPVGMVHATVPDIADDGSYFLYTVLIEKP